MILVCILAGVTCSAAAPQANGFTDVRDMLNETQAVVDKARASLTAFDVSAMGLTYAVGKIIEENRSGAIESADKIQRIITSLRHQQTLSGYFALSVNLERMRMRMQNVTATDLPDSQQNMWMRVVSASGTLVSLRDKWETETMRQLSWTDRHEGRAPYID